MVSWKMTSILLFIHVMGAEDMPSCANAIASCHAHAHFPVFISFIHLDAFLSKYKLLRISIIEKWCDYVSCIINRGNINLPDLGFWQHRLKKGICRKMDSANAAKAHFHYLNTTGSMNASSKMAWIESGHNSICYNLHMPGLINLLGPCIWLSMISKMHYYLLYPGCILCRDNFTTVVTYPLLHSVLNP